MAPTDSNRCKAQERDAPIPTKWINLTLLSVAALLAMSLWFSATAVAPQLAEEWGLTTTQQAWMTMCVQIGFVAGALCSALLNLADRVETRRLFAGSALLGTAVNAAIPIFDMGPAPALAMRFLTGVALAGVYPPGMKLVATWCKEDRGLGIGILVAALTVGSALPHFLNGVPLFGDGGMPPWRSVLYATSGAAILAAVIGGVFVRPGPHAAGLAPFDWGFAVRTFTDRPTRLANFGYLGHMWELYAMWAWAPLCLLESYRLAGWSVPWARLAGFGVISAGAIGCVLAGVFADRLGRTRVAIGSLAVSGSCCVVAGFLFTQPALLTAVCVVWGFAVVADSAQFSAAISELADPRYVGTALTIQTCVGFLLTLVTLQLVSVLRDAVGWEWVFAFLAAGPVFGIWSMARLRQLPEATRMASGNR